MTIVEVAGATIPTEHGSFEFRAFEDTETGDQHLAMVLGEIDADTETLVRVHSECVTGDLMGSLRCDCGMQLDAALRMIAENDQGVLIYLRGHEGRGIGLADKLRAYNLQDQGQDTVEANLHLGLPVDSRDYGAGAQVLRLVGVRKLKLMTNNPAKFEGLEGHGLEIVGRIALELAPNPNNIGYLRTKRDRMGHLLEGLDEPVVQRDVTEEPSND